MFKELFWSFKLSPGRSWRRGNWIFELILSAGLVIPGPAIIREKQHVSRIHQVILGEAGRFFSVEFGEGGDSLLRG